MPAAVASRARDLGKSARAHRDPQPPAKKTKLSQPPAAPRQNGLKALLNTAPDKKAPVAAQFNAAKTARTGKDRVDETQTVVGGGQAGHGDVDMKDADPEVIELSSGAEESEYSSSEDEAGAQEKDTALQVHGHAHEEDRLMENGTAEPEELSFGERLQAQEPEPHVPHVVDVEAAFAGPTAEARTLATAPNRNLSAPTSISLGTTLAQALRTNDPDLLSSCLRVEDFETIYATIERLPSPLVGTLLQKLAERLHKKPGRAGMLMFWVQWSLAAHGGYLASQPTLVKQLATLNKVLKERASGLQPLLSLKGRLDMLKAQLELRRRNQRKAAIEEEDEAVIYVEGEDDISSADEDEGSDTGSVAGTTLKRLRQASTEEGESSDDDMGLTMEVDDDESEAGSEDIEGVFDDEAEETDDDSGDGMSEPGSEDEGVDAAGDASQSEEEAKPARRSTAGRAGLRSRA